MNNKGFAAIMLVGILALSALIFFSPIPTYNSGRANCLLIDKCPKAGFNWEPSLYQRMKQQSELAVEDSNTINKQIDNENQGATADWETYRNEEFGFEFKYPTDWYVGEYRSASPFSLALTPEPYSHEILLDAPLQEGVYVHLSWSFDSDTIPAQQFSSISVAVSHQLQFMNTKTLDRNDFEIDGKQAVTIKGATKSDNPWTNNKPIHTTYVQLDNEVLIISLSGNYKDTYSQILSTFEFIDNNQHPSTKLSTTCVSDSDCKQYISSNNCSLYCANLDENNNKTNMSLPQTCDPTLWDPPLENPCVCIQGNCK